MKVKRFVPLFVFAVVIIFGFQILFNGNSDSKVMSSIEHHREEKVGAEEIYPSIVAEKIRNGEDIILLDVRTPEEYKEEHLKGSILLPVQELSEKTLENIGIGNNSKHKEIIIYCRSGARGKTAFNIMKSLGYTNIKNISGGMTHWEEDGNPFIEHGEYSGVSFSKSGENVVKMDSPKIVIKKDFYDFGVIPQYGGVVTKTFTIENSGSKPLLIGIITTSCSCTSATVSNNKINRGDISVLTVTFDPNLHAEPTGVFKKTVFIPSNDPENSESEVVIQMDIDEGN